MPLRGGGGNPQVCVLLKEPKQPLFFRWDDSPFMNELFQGGTFRHQLRTLALQSHEGQDGQQVIGTAAGREQKAVRLGKGGKYK